MDENNTVVIVPACFPLPLVNKEQPKNIVGKIVADTTGFSCRCAVYPGIDPAVAVPDLGSGYCVLPHRLDLFVSRDRYVVRQSGEPVSVRISVQRLDGSPAVNEPVALVVQPTSGVPGILSNGEGKTDSSGVFTTEYRFPQFAARQVDKITATCRNCNPMSATAEIKMAPVVIGFFNGVWNTEKQAQDGLQALKSLTGPTYRNSTNPIRELLQPDRQRHVQHDAPRPG